MKLNAEIKSNLKLLDFEYGGGIATEATKVDMIDKPVLIVGLGGTGVESLIRTKKSINKYFKLHMTPDGRKMDKPANVEYLAIDSDDNMENLKYGGISFSKENKEFALLESSNLTSIYKNRDSVFKELTKDWISDSLRLQQVKHGAGGIRQAGRFLLFINMNNVINTITEKINKLIINRKANDSIYVFILTGTSGGTGSGTFLDIPYLIRKIAEIKGFETENIGMIFLPDVTLSDNSIDGAAALNIKANGFVGLKELDYLMNIERSGEIFEQSYSDLCVKTNQPPYDLCHLISSKTENGKVIPSAKSYCMNVCAETIINFIASEEVLDGQNYTINSYLSNIENNKATFLMTHSQKKPTNYIYNIVGASSAILPMDYLTNYLTAKVFDEMEVLLKKSPSPEDISQLMQTFKIDLLSIERELELDKPKMKDLSQYDYDVIEKRTDIIEDVLKSELVRYKEHLKNKSDEIILSVQEAIQDKNSILLQHFTDLEIGPFYVNKELSSIFEGSILKEIEMIRKKDIQNKKESRDAIINLELKKQIAMDRMKNKFLGLGVLKKGVAENIIKTSESYYKAIIKNETYDAIDKIYELIYKMLEEYGYNFVDTNCELLLSLKELFDKFKTSENKNAEELGDNFTWDIVSAAEFCDSIGTDEISANYKGILKQFLKEISLNEWVLDKNVNIYERINSFITRELNSTIHKSMDYYFETIARKANLPVGQYISEKIEELRDNAKVMFPMNHVPTGLNIEFPPYSYLSIPFNAPNLKRHVKQICSAGGISNIKFSKMVNRVYMLNLKIAVPLYCYRELNDYESVYEASLGRISGIHLYEGAKINWRNLPSPNYDKLWVAGYENPREHERNEQLRTIFEKSIKYGYIALDDRNAEYICRYGENIDLYDKFKLNKNDIKNKLLSSSKARVLISELTNYISDESRLKYEKRIFDSDIEYAKGVFIYMPELNAKISEEVNRHEDILSILNILRKIEQTEVKYSNFAQILYMGKIYKSRKSYKYIVDGVENSLYTIENVQEKYVEYELFQAFLDLEKAETDYLLKTALREENELSDAAYDDLLETIGSLIQGYSCKLDQLNSTYLEERDGALKVIFYTTVLEVLKKSI